MEKKMKTKTRIKIAICLLIVWAVFLLSMFNTSSEQKNEEDYESSITWVQEIDPETSLTFPRFTSMTLFINDTKLIFELAPGESYYNADEVISIVLPENQNTGFYQVDGEVHFCLAGVRLEGWSISCEELKELICP